MNSQISLIKCDNYSPDLVRQRLGQAINLLGGITKFIKPGSKVLVKPNLLMAMPPDSGIVTHPEVVRQLIRLLKEINCRVIVGDGPSVWGQHIENVDEVYQVSGIKQVCLDEGAQLVKFDKRRMREKFPLTVWLDECDHLISVAKFKTHEFTLLTGAIKNLFGLVSGTFKTELHKNYFKPQDFARILADIYEEARPSLTVIDAILAMEGDGPATSGKPRHLGLLLAGQDCVALDSVLAQIMGIRPLDVLFIREAAGRGLGNFRLNAINIQGEELQGLAVKPFLLPVAAQKTNLPKPLVELAKKLIRYYPHPLRKKCIKCCACIKACPKKCIIMRRKGVFFDYSECIACFCCQEVCPVAAIRVRKSILARMIGL